MSIEIKKNTDPHLEIPEFTCDHAPLGQHLNHWPMLSNLNGYKFTAFIGKPGSGKTSLMVSLLTGRGTKKIFRKVFDHVLVVMPSSSRASMKKNIFKNHSAEKMFEELDLQTMQSIYSRLLESSAAGEKTLLIMDDVGASLKNKDIQQLFRKVIYNRRHLKVHVCVLLQSYISAPKEVRKMVNNVFIFKPSKVEFQNLMAELFETKRDLAVDIMNVAYDKPHQYLMLNVDTQRMFKGFDELVIHTPEDDDHSAGK